MVNWGCRACSRLLCWTIGRSTKSIFVWRYGILLKDATICSSDSQHAQQGQEEALHDGTAETNRGVMLTIEERAC